jgi:putative lipoprotein
MRSAFRIAFALGLAACAGTRAVPGEGGAPPPATDSPRVTGTVTYLQRITLPPTAVIKVQLIDVSRADAPARVLGEQSIAAAGRQPPFAFAIDYEAAKIQPNFNYAVGARIEDVGKLLFISDQRHAVITRGTPKHVDIVLRAVGAAPR